MTMPKMTVWLASAGLLLAACGALAGEGAASLKPVLGTWEFQEAAPAGGKAAQQRFVLTAREQNTCMGGAPWYRAERVSATLRDDVPAAYQYRDGKLAVMLDARICDAYTFYEGTVKGDAFSGKLVEAGWGRAVRGGVSGRRLR